MRSSTGTTLINSNIFSMCPMFTHPNRDICQTFGASKKQSFRLSRSTWSTNMTAQAQRIFQNSCKASSKPWWNPKPSISPTPFLPLGNDSGMFEIWNRRSRIPISRTPCVPVFIRVFYRRMNPIPESLSFNFTSFLNLIPWRLSRNWGDCCFLHQQIDFKGNRTGNQNTKNLAISNNIDYNALKRESEERK